LEVNTMLEFKKYINSYLNVGLCLGHRHSWWSFFPRAFRMEKQNVNK
jgi:hypothetical protein